MVRILKILLFVFIAFSVGFIYIREIDSQPYFLVTNGQVAEGISVDEVKKDGRIVISEQFAPVLNQEISEGLEIINGLGFGSFFPFLRYKLDLRNEVALKIIPKIGESFGNNVAIKCTPKPEKEGRSVTIQSKTTETLDSNLTAREIKRVFGEFRCEIERSSINLGSMSSTDVMNIDMQGIVVFIVEWMPLSWWLAYILFSALIVFPATVVLIRTFKEAFEIVRGQNWRDYFAALK